MALGDLKSAEKALNRYVKDKRVGAFQLGSTLRQLTEVWEIQNVSDKGVGLAQILESELAKKGGASLQMSPDHIRAMRSASPTEDQLERVLGDTGGQTLRWYKTGLERAASVAAIRVKLGSRHGTGFAVKAGDFGLEPENEIMVLTNYHVVNPDGAYPGKQPDKVEIAFEATDDPGGNYDVKEIVWSSPIDGGHDASLLRLKKQPKKVESLPLTQNLPLNDGKQRVYLIGHPRGDELHISLQDNRLLDHEGPNGGTPPNPNVRRVHYHAPTDRGSSGSPVFNDDLWEVVALHHAGSKFDPPDSPGMPKLNGQMGRYSANEGIWIKSIIDAVQQQKKETRAKST